MQLKGIVLMKTTTTKRGGIHINNVYDITATPKSRQVVTQTQAWRRSLTVDSAPSGGRNHVMTAQRYQTEVVTGKDGSWLIEKRSPTGVLQYSESSCGPNSPPGWAPALPNGSISYNRCLEKVFDQLRGGVDLSVGLLQSGQIKGMHKAAATLVTTALTIAGRKAGWSANVINARNNALRQEILRPGLAVERKFKRIKDPIPSNLWRETGEAYLSFSYGLKPLMMDVHGSISQLANACDNSRTLKARASARSFERTGRSSDGGVTRYDWSGESSHRTEMCLVYLPTNSFVETLSRFSSLNPASIAWELLPWSFVFDWFYDVGGYLRALETSVVMPGAASGYVTTTTRQDGTTTATGLGKADPWGYVHTGSLSGRYVYSTKNRALVSSLPLPRKPHFSADLGSSRLLNAASLLSTFLGRK